MFVSEDGYTKAMKLIMVIQQNTYSRMRIGACPA